MRQNSSRGFSLLELMITVSIILIMGGVTFISLQPLMKQNDVHNAYDTTLEVIRNYRNMAITKSSRETLGEGSASATAAKTPARAALSSRKAATRCGSAARLS